MRGAEWRTIGTVSVTTELGAWHHLRGAHPCSRVTVASALGCGSAAAAARLRLRLGIVEDRTACDLSRITGLRRRTPARPPTATARPSRAHRIRLLQLDGLPERRRQRAENIERRRPACAFARPRAAPPARRRASTSGPGPRLATRAGMTTRPVLTALIPTSATDVVHEDEPAEAAKTGDDAAAPTQPEQERQQLVRDAYGNDPYGGDRHNADGDRDEIELGKAPYELPDPQVAALRRVKASEPSSKS
jgi:hypothetical protein